MTKRIALGIEYDGQHFFGWQEQQGLPTVQGILQTALSKVANETIFLHCAGRTDAGVHALGQVVHFDTDAKRHIDAWMLGTNTWLPPTVVVKWAKQVDYHFHARFKATARRYRYIIHNHPIRPGILQGKVTWHYYPLDAAVMHTAAQVLLGEQDFSSFRAAQCGSKTAMRNITAISVERQGHYVILEVEANAFLHHMVRNIVGSLLKIGGGFQPISWLQAVLQAKDRRAAGATASPDGLYLTQVTYPENYAFPMTNAQFLL